ncbi:MAG TPA: hypothetical protein IAC09_05395 [Candidatus Cryptobacteroides intestinipullorum]|nr:hypothetical protein [Candidatus Cryptobacteroides intestinipullorum]
MKSLFRLFQIICCLAGLASCKEQPLVTDSPDYLTFTVSNMTDSDITLSGKVNMKEYSIVIVSGKEYSYSQDAMSGAVVDNGIPVYSFETVKMTMTDNREIELSSSVFQGLWKETGDHHIGLTIDQSFLERYSE